MPYVMFDTTGGAVAVRVEQLFAAVDTADAGVELRLDGAREVVTTEAFGALAAKLPGFVALPGVGAPCLVNPRQVALVIPHPSNPNVSFLQGLSQRIPVNGTVAQTVHALGG